MLLKKMGKGWLIQLDLDEYVYEFQEVAKYLKKYNYLTLFPKLTPIAFKGRLITLYRQLPEGYVYVDSGERFSFITNQRSYTYVRNNRDIRNHFSNITVIYQSWARTEEDIKMRINNWGHRDDFDVQQYFEFWKNLSSENYTEYSNIHPISPQVWDRLHFLAADSIYDFISRFAAYNSQQLQLIDPKKWFGH